MDTALERALFRAAAQNELSCADAHLIAARYDLSPERLAAIIAEDGRLRFDRCQLGLFGYGPKAEGRSKIVLAATNLPPNMVADLQSAATDGRIACATVWDIALRHRYPRLGVANVCQALGLKVSPCQLGCF
jgi:hypothetical protein